jgi:hypothetical protein
MSQTQHRFCLSTVRILKKLKDAAPFLQPVDPNALGIPHYPSTIKHPMDLGTVERKLISSNPTKPDPSYTRPPYLGTSEFIHDVKLIFKNCDTFNGPEHAITQMGRRLEAVFDKQIKQLPANEEVCPYFSHSIKLLGTQFPLACQDRIEIKGDSATATATHYQKGSSASPCFNLRPYYSPLRV